MLIRKQAVSYGECPIKGVYSVAAGDSPQQQEIGLTNATLGLLLVKVITIPASWGQLVAYGVSGYNHTLDDGYHANLSAGDGSAATLDISWKRWLCIQC